MEITTGTPIGKIILAGHSQGGALALYAALTYKPRKEIWSTIDIERYVDLVSSNEKYPITDILEISSQFLLNHVFITSDFRKTTDYDRLGAVVTFGAWLPMSHKFAWFQEGEFSRSPTEMKHGPLRILQVRNFP